MTKAEYPYNDYDLYVVFHKKEGRYYAQLILSSNRKIRTTLSYARYLMSVKEKRILRKEEKVDHIDNNKQNDSIENLQILSDKQNKDKYIKESNMERKMVEFECPNCYKIFSKEYHVSHLGKPKGIFTSCSRKCCGTLRQRLQVGEIINFSNNIIKIYYEKSINFIK